MDAIARFATLVAQRDPTPVALDEGALCIAAALRPPVDEPAVLEALDALARTCQEATFDGVRDAIFTRAAFAGNRLNYADPENSLLDAVMRRRLGIPITLALVMIEVGRRIDVAISPVGMPGHFLVRDDATGRFCDPFAGGILLDAEGCRDRYTALFGSRRPFHPSLLERSTSRSVLARVLANLEQTALANDRRRLEIMLELHRSIPDLVATDRLAIAARYEAIGYYADAARQVDGAVAILPEPQAATARAKAISLRARTN